jgi:phosphate-selective porin OprO/OprP
MRLMKFPSRLVRHVCRPVICLALAWAGMVWPGGAHAQQLPPGAGNNPTGVDSRVLPPQTQPPMLPNGRVIRQSVAQDGKPEPIGPPEVSGGEPAPAEENGKDNFRIDAAYKYNAGGGYLSVFSPEGEFSVNLQNQVTIDGTFHDRNVGTIEQGFNIPFYRTFLYGNVTKNLDYQVSVQGFLGQFNVLDAWGNARYDDRLNLRIGRQLTGFLYEYYGWSPAWEPVITNSPLFQVAGKRQIGANLWGRLLENKIQYQAGVFNGVPGSFFGVGRNVSFIGNVFFTPWKGTNDFLDSLGAGVGVDTGWQDIAFSDVRTSAAGFINGAGEPTLNSSLITSTGVPFFTYASTVRSQGNVNKVAPGLFYFNRFSLTAEYLVMNRFLLNTKNGAAGNSVIHGYYINTSYFLTGERYRGDGLGGYTTIEPIRPFRPAKGEWGIGAWELAFQVSQLNVGNADVTRFAAAGTPSTNRLDQTMLGVNWWPNKYTRWSFDWMYDHFNNPISPTGGTTDLTKSINVYWVRMAMFF